MFDSLGPYAFFIFAVFNLLAVVIVYCLYPETACRTLEEIDFLFGSKTPFVWETEKRFMELKEEHAAVMHVSSHEYAKMEQACTITQEDNSKNQTG